MSNFSSLLKFSCLFSYLIKVFRITNQWEWTEIMDRQVQYEIIWTRTFEQITLRITEADKFINHNNVEIFSKPIIRSIWYLSNVTLGFSSQRHACSGKYKIKTNRYLKKKVQNKTIPIQNIYILFFFQCYIFVLVYYSYSFYWRSQWAWL